MEAGPSRRKQTSLKDGRVIRMVTAMTAVAVGLAAALWESEPDRDGRIERATVVEAGETRAADPAHEGVGKLVDRVLADWIGKRAHEEGCLAALADATLVSLEARRPNRLRDHPIAERIRTLCP